MNNENKNKHQTKILIDRTRNEHHRVNSGVKEVHLKNDIRKSGEKLKDISGMHTLNRVINGKTTNIYESDSDDEGNYPWLCRHLEKRYNEHTAEGIDNTGVYATKDNKNKYKEREYAESSNDDIDHSENERSEIRIENKLAAEVEVQKQIGDATANAMSTVEGIDDSEENIQNDFERFKNTDIATSTKPTLYSKTSHNEPSDAYTVLSNDGLHNQYNQQTFDGHIPQIYPGASCESTDVTKEYVFDTQTEPSCANERRHYEHFDEAVYESYEDLFDENKEDLDCDMCFVEGKNVAASTYCFDCEIYMCGSCQRYHKKFMVTRHHSTIHNYQNVKTIHGDGASLQTRLISRDKHKKYEHAAMCDMRLVDFGKFTNQNVNANDTLCGPCLYEMRKEEATNFCIECMQYMCRSCKVYHMKFDLPIKHTVIHVREMDLDEFKSFVPCYDNEVHYKELFDKPPPARTGLPYKPPLQQLQAHKIVSTKICEDLQHPNITGIAFCRRGQLLLCDHNNRRLKLFSTEFIPLSHIDLGEIADVAVLNDSNAVITLPEKKKLLFVSIHGDSKLIQNKKIATIGHYWGTEYVNEELFALSMSDTISQATVHILSCSGNILSVIHPSLGLDYNFSLNNSKYLAVSPSGGTIYVADAEIGVIAVGLDGRIILNRYDDDLDNARGIVVDTMSVYVCSRDTNRVVQLSHDGSLSSVLLGQSDNLVQPCCIAMDTPGKKMIISMADVVKVYVYS